MPALMRGMINSAPVPDSPGRWLRGEIVSAGEQNEPMGFGQLPITDLGSFSVSQINNYPNDPNIYSAVKLTDAGTVTMGAAPVDVAADDVIIWMPFFLPDGELDPTGWRWVNNGPITLIPNVFFHIRIKDKTVEEVQEYLEAFTKKVSYESLQYDPVTDNRRVRVTNDYITATGGNGFTDEGTQAVVDEWNGLRVSWTPSNFVMDAILPPEKYDEFRESVEELALNDLYKRRRWYINAAGMNALTNNGYVINGTGAEVGQYLRDGLLD